MRARACSALACVAVLAGTAAAEPKPKPVDIKAFRDKLIVLQDDQGGVYAVLPGDDQKAFYGTASSKKLYTQIIQGSSSDGSTGSWEIDVWAPRVPEIRPGVIARASDGTFFRSCGEEKTPLTQLSADKSKALLDKATFFTSALIRRPHLLARDDSGVYYYVDVIRNEYGGKGYRVFVGKKGAMKQRPLTDIATDTAGDVFATKTGDLRIVRDTDQGTTSAVTWVKGEKRVQLRFLDPDANSPLIFKDLGVYGFTGTICDSI